MKISVVSVCYNAAPVIGETVRSFLAQDYTDKELLIIDGNSSDHTIEVVRNFADQNIRIVSEDDCGIYDAMNKGLARFSGDVIGFLNAGDTYHDQTVLTQIAIALENADVAYGDLDMISDLVSRKIVRKWRADEFSPGAFASGWMPPHPTFYARRELAVKTGLFDLKYSISADYDFMLRALEMQRPRVRYIPQVLVDFMIGGVSTAGLGAVVRGNLECLRARRQHLKTPMLDAAFFLKPLRKIGQHRWCKLSNG